MKNTKKAFTLVELIVVITILAVLATVAFISLTGHAQDAKNSKVASDLRSLASALETGMTKGDVTMGNVINTSLSGSHAVDGTAGNGDINLASTTASKYDVGTINFGVIQQNGENFKDSDGNDYLYAFTASGSFAGYQLVGQKKNPAGQSLGVVTGNYFAQGSDDAGLVSQSGANTDAVLNDTELANPNAGLY